jgi:hypothetical protein
VQYLRRAGNARRAGVIGWKRNGRAGMATMRLLCFRWVDDAVQYSRRMELIFEIRDAEEGGFYARALGHGIFTQAESWDE